jgi:competence protein ComGC
VVVVLIVLAALFFQLGHLKHQREAELARMTGNDEQTNVIQAEAEDYRLANRNQQIGVLGVGAIVLLVAGGWWIRCRKNEHRTGRS